jgi:peptidoglycan/xylan/chitin deacetylase (PgdA/CDA1 family)
MSARPSHSLPYLACREAYRRARRLVQRERPWHGVRVLAYHRVSDADDALAVSPALFAQQMAVLRESGLAIQRLRDARCVRDVSNRVVCVTFYDGYRDNLTDALPILHEHGIAATIFLPTGIIDGTDAYRWYDDPPPALDWAEVRDMQAEGLVDFQAHTISHPLLPDVDAARARREIVDGRRILEERLGRAVSCLCYPAGRYGSREVQLAREAGYLHAVTTRPGVNGRDTPELELRRSLVDWQHDAARFHALLHGAFDRGDRVTSALRRARLLPAQ